MVTSNTDMVSSQKLKSTQILDDCQRSLDLLEMVPDGDKQLFRIYWAFCLVSLRRVKDALEKYDLILSSEARIAYEKRKKALGELKNKYGKDTPFSECEIDYLVYHRLIHVHESVYVCSTS